MKERNTASVDLYPYHAKRIYFSLLLNKQQVSVCHSECAWLKHYHGIVTKYRKNCRISRAVHDNMRLFTTNVSPTKEALSLSFSCVYFEWKSMSARERFVTASLHKPEKYHLTSGNDMYRPVKYIINAYLCSILRMWNVYVCEREKERERERAFAR